MDFNSCSSVRGLRHYDSHHLPVVLSGILLMTGLCVWILWQDIWIFYSWRLIFNGLGEWSGNTLDVVLSRENILNVTVDVPSLTVSAEESLGRVITAGLFCLGLSFLVPARHIPCRYILRTLCVMLFLSAGGGILFRENINPDINSYIATVFHTGFWFIVLAPLFFALMAFTLPGNLVLRLGWVLLSELYLILIVPVTALCHWLILIWGGPLLLPVTGCLGTVFLFSFYLTAFYGVAASVETL
ncbi:hypothetical protein JV07_09865 [Salmonella enterica]|uniref:hypothetical protein n=1 Tax=Escherichia fergusonii TaxID=564 RepID=UPI0015E9BC1A|nr:hypothetical protein [Escherichia fergusonii]EAY4988073.1 hypothetical protein [Salmonella enterica]EJC1536197.1 hypothetical protein [Salmonella enterica subsp. enterica serovar Montevideo]MBA8503772.1 hypothetical protein [Escherichia fergusonii]QMS07735.1 hypothetical protein HVX36_21460 [Escherichia fergusonii]